MRGYGALLFLASFITPALSHADIVKPGSTFNVALAEAGSSGFVADTNAILTAGGSTQFTFNGLVVTASETEATLPGGQLQILVTFTASGDLFPELIAGRNYDGFVGVGDRNAIQFTTPFDLISAVLTFSSPSGPYVSDDFIGFISHTTPFNGQFLGNFEAGGYTSVGGLDTTSITLDLRGTPAPEPSSFALLGTGLFCLAGALRKRFS